MESTLADIRQLFNVKAVADNTKIDALADGELGVFPEGSDTSVAGGVTFATLPERFRLALNHNGKLLFSFDTIEKSKMHNIAFKAYEAGQINIWEGVIKGCGCNCMESILMHINIDEAQLIQEEGLSWAQRDFVVQVSPEELQCLCDCEGKDVYENNIMTSLVVKNINANESSYYDAEVKLDIAGVDSGAALPSGAGEEKGDLYIKNAGGDEGLYVYDGTDWVLVGEEDGTMTDTDTYLEATEALNLDDVVANHGPYMTLVVKGKDMPATPYRDLENNYVTPRGVRITPTLKVNGKTIVFTETQELKFETGAGADVRAEEWENMNFYTNLNFYPQLSDGIANKDLQYQFENGKQYDGLVFEFSTPKVERNTGETRLFGVYLGTSESTASSRLQDLFIE